jgi:hypothetical protein
MRGPTIKTDRCACRETMLYAEVECTRAGRNALLTVNRKGMV